MAYLDKNFDYRQPEFTEAYDELPVWSAHFGLVLLNEMPMLAEGKALDLGCGTGFPLTTLAARLGPSAEVIGLEQWQAAIERANRRIKAMRLENARVVEGDVHQIPFPDDHFDLVTANLVLNNVADPESMFKEVLRVLRPGGYFCITSNPVGTFSEIYDLLLEAAAHLGLPETLHNLALHSASRLSPSQVEELFLKAGFNSLYKSESKQRMRWANGTAFLNDPFIIMAFLPGWRACFPKNVEKKVFHFLERSLNAHAQGEKGIPLSLPVLYMEGRKPV